ncbi:MAG TPA: hypothetical protein QGF58_08700 [Myxococcota bacterium]|nr:hypothetical protein [Myxococcota bacterium]
MLLALVLGAEARPLEDPTWSIEAHTLAMQRDATGGFGAAVVGDKNGFLRLDGRSQASGDWLARGTAGFDVFGRWDFFDLTLGASMGGAGDWHDFARGRSRRVALSHSARPPVLGTPRVERFDVASRVPDRVAAERAVHP